MGQNALRFLIPRFFSLPVKAYLISNSIKYPLKDTVENPVDRQEILRLYSTFYKPFSGFLYKAISAYRAGDLNFLSSSGNTQRVLALGAFIIFMLFIPGTKSFARKEIFQHSPEGKKCFILPAAGINIFRKHPEKAPEKQQKRKPGQNRPPKYLRQDI